MEKIIGLLFLARDLAHREHLLTNSYSEHVALEKFYSEIVDLADSLAETTMGRMGPFKDIPMVENEFTGPIDDVLESQLAWLEEQRYVDVPETETAIQNIVDEVIALYLQTLYRLRQFK